MRNDKLTTLGTEDDFSKKDKMLLFLIKQLFRLTKLALTGQVVQRAEVQYSCILAVQGFSAA